MIISGFAGIGKSYIARNLPNFIDLDRGEFSSVEEYVNVIKARNKNGYNMLVGCDTEIINELKRQKLDFKVIIPRIEDKEIWMKRFQDRTEKFQKWIYKRWDYWLGEVYDLNVELHIIKPNEYLIDIINEL